VQALVIQDGVQNYAGYLYDELGAISIGSDLDGSDYFSLSATGELTVNGLTAFVAHSNQILSPVGLADEATNASEGYTPLTCNPSVWATHLRYWTRDSDGG